MITTKYNFKHFCNKKYPHHNLTPIYGLSAYLLDKPLDAMDMYTYNVQQLASGKYVIFLGLTPKESSQLIEQFRVHGIPSYKAGRQTAPTTFACFERWLKVHNIVPVNRTFCSQKTPYELLHDETVLKSLERRTWYLYELNKEDITEDAFINIPHITVTNKDGTQRLAVLIKASEYQYISKRQRFVQQFSAMQPIYEKLVAACALDNKEEAKQLCEQYMGIQFERTGHIDIEKMMEAYKNGALGFFTRDPDNLLKDDSFEMD